jgi:hypothetical protein
MVDWFNAVPEWGLGIAAILLLLGAAEGGVIIASPHKRAPEGVDRFLSTLAAPSIGLLALMIGFTFSMALSRYEARVAEVVDAANTIGKAALRGRMLPEPYRSAVIPLLKEYATLRVAREGEQVASSAMMATNRRALEIQERLWNEATAAAASSPQVVPTGLFIESLNDVIDTFEKRLHAGRDRVPTPVFLMLEVIAMVAFGFTAFGAHWGSAYIRWPMWVMAALIGVVITLIIDLDRSENGLITVSQQPLLDMIETIKMNESLEPPKSPG